MSAAECMRKIPERGHVPQVGASGWVYAPKVDRKSAEEFFVRIIELTDYNRWDFIRVMLSGTYNQEAYGSDIEYLSENIPSENLYIKQIMRFSRHLI